MPYSTNASLPDSVKGSLSSEAQSIFRNAFNSAVSRGLSEERAFRIGWGAVKNAGYTKGEDGKWVKVKKSEDVDEEKEYLDFCEKEGERIEKAQIDFEVVKVADTEGLVYGWGMVSSINGEPYFDTDNDHINDEEIRKSSTDFMLGQRISNDIHTNSDIGIVVHSFPLTEEISKAMGITSIIKGWAVAVKPNAEILEKFKTGEYRGFSIEGKASAVEVGQDEI